MPLPYINKKQEHYFHPVDEKFIRNISGVASQPLAPKTLSLQNAEVQRVSGGMYGEGLAEPKGYFAGGAGLLACALVWGLVGGVWAIIDNEYSVTFATIALGVAGGVGLGGTVVCCVGCYA